MYFLFSVGAVFVATLNVTNDTKKVAFGIVIGRVRSVQKH